MPKKLFTLLILSLFVFVGSAHAATLSLTKIGALNTNGSMYGEWWYTGTNPSLEGTAGAGAEVKITINDSVQTTNASSDGSWSATTTMPAGDHNVSITSGGETYSFVLHTGQEVPTDLGNTTNVPETTGSTGVPETGSNQVIGGALALLALSLSAWYFTNGRKKALSTFEENTVQKL